MNVRIFLTVTALMCCATNLVSMESVVQLHAPSWQYDEHTFKFAPADSKSDKDIIEVPGNLVRHSKTLVLMIEDLGADEVIPLSHIKKQYFNLIVHALKALDNPKTAYANLEKWFTLFNKQQLLTFIDQINFLDIQPLLEPALRVLFEKSPNVFALKSELSPDMVNIMKNMVLEDIKPALMTCSWHEDTKEDQISSLAYGKNYNSAETNGMDLDNNIRVSFQGKSINLAGHTGPIYALKFSPNEQMLASVSPQDHTLRLWDIDTQKEKIQFDKDLVYLDGMQFSADNNYFAYEKDSQEENSYALVDSKTKQMRLLNGIEGSINKFVVSANGTNVAFVGQQLYVANTQTEEVKAIDFGEGLSPQSIAFNHDGTLLACSVNQPEEDIFGIVFVDMDTLEKSTLNPIRTKSAPQEMVFSEDNRLLAFDVEEDVFVWDIQDDKQIAEIGGHHTHVHSIAFTPDSKQVVTTAHDNILRIFNLQSKSEKKFPAKSSDVINFANVINNSIIISISEAGSIDGWNIATGESKTMFAIPDFQPHAEFSKDNTLLAVSAPNGDIYILNLKAGGKQTLSRGNYYEVTDLEFGNNNQSLIATYANGTALIWDIKTGKSEAIHAKQDNGIQKAEWVGDSGMIIIEEKPKSVINLYDIANNVSHELMTSGGYIQKFVFTPNGKQLIVSTSDGMITMWDVATQKITKSFNVQGVTDCALNPDGTLLAVVSWHGLSVIDLTNGTKYTLERSEDFSGQMAFDQSGKFLVVAKSNTEDKSQKILDVWNMETRMFNYSISIPMDYIDYLFFVPNSQLIVAVGNDGAIFCGKNVVYDVPLTTWIYGIGMNGVGEIITVSGQNKETNTDEVKNYVLNQNLLKYLNTASPELLFILGVASQGRSLDLSKSPNLLDIFNQIPNKYREYFENCFDIKTK